jgi:hypothetical protein
MNKKHVIGMDMPERRKGPTQPRVRPVNVRWRKSQVVADTEEETVTRSAHESVQSQMLTALIDGNKLLRDQNRMIWDLLQAQEPKSSTTAYDAMEPAMHPVLLEACPEL